MNNSSLFRTRLCALLLLILFVFVGIPLGHGMRSLPEPVPAVEAEPSWDLIADDVTATVYNAVRSQCDGDPLVTASMYRIVPERIAEDRILAMERTMMAEYGIRYGDIVMVEGAGDYDGEWQVQDTMHKRFAGQHKIDFLVPAHIRHGKWKNIKVYKRG